MLVVDNGDAIRGIAEVATKLDYIVNGYVGTTATQLADGQLGTGEADLYLSGADGIVVTSITIVNTDSAARTFTLYLKPSGGTSRAITPVSLDLGIGHSLYTDGQRIVVTDLSGGIVSTAAVHALGGSQHDADTLSNLNGKISDATLVDASAISSEIDGDISTHAALATVHQDAPALIVTHAGDIDAHVSGATAGELLVATGATTAVWKNTGVKLSAPDISGVVTAAAALTMPAMNVGVLTTTITDGSVFIMGADNRAAFIRGGGNSGGSGGGIRLTGKSFGTAGRVSLYTPDAAGTGDVERLQITGVLGTAVATWANITHTGLVLSGPLTLNGQAFDAGAVDAEIRTTGAFHGLKIVNTQDGSSGARLYLVTDSASPTVGDIIGNLIVQGNLSDGGQTDYLYERLLITNAATATKAAKKEWWVANAGSISLKMTLFGAGVLDVLDSFKVNGTQVVSARGAAVADASDAASVILRLNDLLARLRTHGMIAT